LRMYLKEDINKIDEELKSLGVLPDSEEYKVRLLNWWQSLTNDQKKAVPTSKTNNTVDLRSLFSDVPVSHRKVREYLKNEIKMIDTELKLLGVLLDVEIYKKRLLNWWHSLTDEQKLAVPTNKNTIDLRDRLSDAPVTYVQIRQYLK
ncbi:hypothetical protein EAY24_25670, partial [Vibrio anguillarum]|nr:hypothetical protein [Vibrio anguillarum]